MAIEDTLIPNLSQLFNDFILNILIINQSQTSSNSLLFDIA